MQNTLTCATGDITTGDITTGDITTGDITTGDITTHITYKSYMPLSCFTDA